MITGPGARARRTAALAAGALLLLSGCGGSGPTIPSDPHGTLDAVRGGTLRAGVSVQPPWTETGPAADGGPAGLEPDLLRALAEELDAEVEWTTGGEEALVGALDRGELDVVVGGLTTTSPWVEHAALTASYVSSTAPDGTPEDHVMAVRAGENAFQVELERFLLDQDVEDPA